MAAPKAKTEREKEVLFGLIENFLESGRPIGSNTLKESNFDHLSSATIRNYFSKLESGGFLEQQHSSGGRIPTEKAFRCYVDAFYEQGVLETEAVSLIEKIRTTETKEVSLFLRKTTEELSSLTNNATFISLPKFDSDFIVDIKLLPIDSKRLLIALITDFGSVQTEILMIDQKVSTFSAKRIETYLHNRLTGQNKPEEITPEEELLASRFYNEAVVRFFVGNTNSSSDDLLRAGFSKMLYYPELREGTKLAETLSLFENQLGLRHLLRESIKRKELKVWIGSELAPFGTKSKDTAVMAIPYFINSRAVGAFGVLGPTRIHYRKLIGLLNAVSHAISQSLTNSFYKFKLTCRQPETWEQLQIAYKSHPLIENKKAYHK